MSRFAALTAFAILSTALAAHGQTAAPADHPAVPKQTFTPAADVLRSYNGLKANILKAADKMPTESYSFRPTPEVRTFARVVNHISEAQLRSCGTLNETAPEALYKVPPETADKAAIVAALQASFAECDKAYAALTETNMLQMLTLGPVTRARIGFAWGNVSHDNEQYATLALYMRLKGLVPPSSEK
ncbi:DinB family protein [Acidicapsa acidisoli]|uniref:DinB family protein n=1 Tax=Acidicapsa acidisoli TaxID=1615681 RepID=UPI0021E0DF08|nr:DinB family protein [Acidicapsa acidisoli]